MNLLIKHHWQRRVSVGCHTWPEVIQVSLNQPPDLTSSTFLAFQAKIRP